MAVKINWTNNSQVVNGPKVSGSGTVEADAYDNVEVTVPNDGNAVTVEVQPGGAGKVKFLLIKSDNYDALTYDIDPPGGTIKNIGLDSQLLLVGEGALKLAGGAPKSFAFTNNGAADANLLIFVARDAI